MIDVIQNHFLFPKGNLIRFFTLKYLWLNVSSDQHIGIGFYGLVLRLVLFNLALAKTLQSLKQFARWKFTHNIKFIYHDFSWFPEETYLTWALQVEFSRWTRGIPLLGVKTCMYQMAVESGQKRVVRRECLRVVRREWSLLAKGYIPM